MRPSRGLQVRVIATVVVLSAVVCTLPARAGDEANLAGLVRLARAEDEEYIALRNTLLAKADAPWNVVEAARADWGAGLATLICNARLAHPDVFAKADEIEMVQDIRGTWGKHYGLVCRNREAFAALMIETAWKTAEHPDVRRGALLELRSCSGKGPSELWEAIWSGTDDEGLRNVAIQGLAHKESEVAERIVTVVLSDPSQKDSIRLAALRGLLAANPPYALQLVFSVLPTLADNPRLAELACRLLVSRGGPNKRRLVLGFASDRTKPVALRVAAIGVCDSRPQDDDIPVLLAAMRDADHPEVQLAAVQSSIAYSYKALRAGLRSLLVTDTNIEVAEAAMRLLVMCRDEGDQELVRAFRDREDINDELRAAIDRQFRILASKEVKLEHMRQRARETGVNLELIERIIAGQRSCEPDSKLDDE